MELLNSLSATIPDNAETHVDTDDSTQSTRTTTGLLHYCYCYYYYYYYYYYYKC